MALEKATLGAIRAGLGISYAGLCVMAGVVVITVLAALGLDLSPRSISEVPRLVRALIAGLAVGLLLGGLIDLMGRLRCRAVPAEFFGRPALTASIVLLVLGLAPFLWRAISVAANLPALPLVVHRALEVAIVASPLVFLSFLREVARSIDRRDQDEALGVVQTAGLVLVVGFVLLRALDLALTRADEISARSFVVLELVGYTLIELGVIVAFVLYSKSLLALRAALYETMNPVEGPAEADTLWTAPEAADVIESVRGPDFEAGLPPSGPSA